MAVQKKRHPGPESWPIGARWYGVTREGENAYRWTCPACGTDHVTGGPRKPVLKGCCNDQMRARATQIQIDRKLGKVQKARRKPGPKPKKVTKEPSKG